MKAETFLKHFPEYDEAFTYMTQRNKSFQKAGNDRDVFCVVPGPESNYAVVDLRTAIDLELGYVWNYSSTGYINNPF